MLIRLYRILSISPNILYTPHRQSLKKSIFQSVCYDLGVMMNSCDFNSSTVYHSLTRVQRLKDPTKIIKLKKLKKLIQTQML